MTEKAQDEFQDGLAKLVNKAIEGGASAEAIATILILTAQDFADA